jgi:DNA ligase (NAD+)
MKKEIDKLILLLRYYDYNYHVLGKSVVPDEEYDKMLDKLDKMEKEANYFPTNSPIRNIGFTPNGCGKTVDHDPPMLSVRGSYDLEEIRKVLQEFLNYSNVIMEPKIDGLSVSLIYNYGLLESASLRGDGLRGEDITHHIYYVNNIPVKIGTEKEFFEIRGEIFLPKDIVSENNNARNMAVGLLRRKVLPKNILSFLPYSIPTSDNTHKQDLDFLKIIVRFLNVKFLRISKILIKTYIALMDLILRLMV